MADQCYFDGNFYQCLEATAPGESPTTNPDKWSLIQIPAEWRFVVARLAFANLLELDGQMDKAERVRSDAHNRDRVGLVDMIRNEANNELDSRPGVIRALNN